MYKLKTLCIALAVVAYCPGALAQGVRDCNTNEAPSPYSTVTCDNGGTAVCTHTGGFPTTNMECSLALNGGSAAASLTLVTDFDGSGRNEHSVYGSDASGANFCCVYEEDPGDTSFQLVYVGVGGDDGDDILQIGDFAKSIPFYDPLTGGGDLQGITVNSELEDGDDYATAYTSGSWVRVHVGGNSGEDTIDFSNIAAPSYNASPHRIRGGNDDDILTGSGFRDQIFGQSGGDKLYGLDGDDDLVGGEGDDVCEGGDGDDKLWGDGANDYLLGEGGNDMLQGGPGTDDLIGGPDDDQICSGTGTSDYLQGDAGKDTLYAPTGAVTPTGDAGSGTNDRCGHNLFHGVYASNCEAWNLGAGGCTAAPSP